MRRSACRRSGITMRGSTPLSYLLPITSSLILIIDNNNWPSIAVGLPLHIPSPMHPRCAVNHHCMVVALLLRLPLLSSLSRCCCNIHCRLSPTPLHCRRAVALPSSPLPSLLLLPPPPLPAFADLFVGWLLHCCPPSAFVITFCHATC